VLLASGVSVASGSVPAVTLRDDVRGASWAGRPRRLEHGYVITHQGDVDEMLYLVTAGAVRLASVTADGREVVVALLGMGDVFGECALLGRPSPVEARAVGHVDVVAIPVPLLGDVVERRPTIAEQLLRLAASRLHRTSRALEQALVEDVPTRVTRRLRDLAVEHGTFGDEGVTIGVPLTQEELGRMVGASRETVNRTLRGLTARGLVRTYEHTVVIPDPAALEPEPEPVSSSPS
jgi:CRP/FNR family transcriptional regulator, cyclic AMP receptor protein